MVKKHYLDRMDLPDEMVPGESLVEIAGYRRVLVEHHQGVVAYSREKVCVKVPYGVVSVCGEDLELMRMSKDQLIISGSIHSITLDRGQSQ